MNTTINFKHGSLAEQFGRLRAENPALYAMVVTAADYAWRVYRQYTTITSIYRPDDTDSVHGHWRGVDVRIEHPDRFPPLTRRDEELGWSEECASEVARWLPFQYDAENSHEILIVHGETLNRHAHLQLGEWSRVR